MPFLTDTFAVKTHLKTECLRHNRVFQVLRAMGMEEVFFFTTTKSQVQVPLPLCLKWMCLLKFHCGEIDKK